MVHILITLLSLWVLFFNINTAQHSKGRFEWVWRLHYQLNLFTVRTHFHGLRSLLLPFSFSLSFNNTNNYQECVTVKCTVLTFPFGSTQIAFVRCNVWKRLFFTPLPIRGFGLQRCQLLTVMEVCYHFFRVIWAEMCQRFKGHVWSVGLQGHSLVTVKHWHLGRTMPWGSLWGNNLEQGQLDTGAWHVSTPQTM